MGTKQEGGEWLGHRTSVAPGVPEPNLNFLGAGSQLGKGVLGTLPHRKGREGSIGETLPALLTLLLETLCQTHPPRPPGVTPSSPSLTSWRQVSLHCPRQAPGHPLPRVPFQPRP